MTEREDLLEAEIERLTPYVEAFRREEARADKLGREVDKLCHPECLTGCFHKLGPDSCQNLGGCQSEACDHYNKTEYRPRMTLLAQVDGVLYPAKETK